MGEKWVCEKTNLFSTTLSKTWKPEDNSEFPRTKIMLERNIRPTDVEQRKAVREQWVLEFFVCLFVFLFSIYSPFADLYTPFSHLGTKTLLPRPNMVHGGEHFPVCSGGVHLMGAWLHHCDGLRAGTHDSIWVNESLLRTAAGTTEKRDALWDE